MSAARLWLGGELLTPRQAKALFPKRRAAALKAWKTRRRRAAALKAWETRRRNQNANIVANIYTQYPPPTLPDLTVLKSSKKKRTRVVKTDRTARRIILED